MMATIAHSQGRENLAFSFLPPRPGPASSVFSREICISSTYTHLRFSSENAGQCQSIRGKRLILPILACLFPANQPVKVYRFLDAVIVRFL
jgi:hypothetical protein